MKVTLCLPPVYHTKLDEVMKVILSNLSEYIDEIWLFGSCSRCEVINGSDIDLMLVSNIKPRELLGMVLDYDLIDDTCLIPVDIVCRTRENLSDMSQAFNQYVERDKIVLWRR